MAAEALGTARIYWAGAHATQRLASPLGKVHAEGLRLLREHGWQQAARDDPRVPAWAFTTRKGADLPAAGPGLPKVRQLPQACSAALDDKRLLAEALQAAGCAHVAPRTWPDACAFLRQHDGGDAQAGGLAEAAGAAGEAAGQLYFLKHRFGVKGQAVYAFASLPPLLDRLRRLCAGGSGGGQQFVVQRGVAPPLLLPDGRRFTLRAHVLLLLQGEQALAQPEQQQPLGRPVQAPQDQPGQLQAFVHEDVIVTPHALPLGSSRSGAGSGSQGPATAAAAEADPAVHISSRGSGHPQPFLLAQLALAQQQQQQQQGAEGSAAALRRELWQQVCEVCRAAVAAAAPRGLVPRDADPHAVFCHLFAFDLAAATAAPSAATTTAATTAAATTAARGAAAAGASGLPPERPSAAAMRHDAPEAPGAPSLPPGIRVQLLEANSYPAIASGTMAAVPRSVYTRLVGDVLSLAAGGRRRRAASAACYDALSVGL